MIGIDMKMPKICGKCRFATAFECIINRKFIRNHDKKSAHCPLVEINKQAIGLNADDVNDALKILKSWNGGIFVEKREDSISYGYLEAKITKAIKTAIKALEIMQNN